MKHPITRAVSVLLVLIMTLSLLPAAQASPSNDPVGEAKVFVAFPMGGAHPNMKAQTVGTANYTVDFVHFFDCYDGHPTGSFLSSNAVYTTGRRYACQVHLVPKSGYTFTESSEVLINERWPEEMQLEADGSAYYMVYFTAAGGTVTVSFDANGGKNAPAPLEVPIGGAISDVVPDVRTLDLPDRGYEEFLGWSTSPFADGAWDAEAYWMTITEPVTYYAIWYSCLKQLDLGVILQSDLSQDAAPPEIFELKGRNVWIESNNWWVTRDSVGVDDLIFSLPFTEYLGHSFYSYAEVYLDLAEKLPAVNLYGAKLLSSQRIDDYTLRVLFSVDLPKAGSSLTNASVFLSRPAAGDSANEVFPNVCSLTPGLHVGTDYWYETPSVTFTEPYYGKFQEGKTYYTLLTFTADYPISYNTLKLKLEGDGVALVDMVDLASWYSIPNYVGAVVSVTIPKGYEFAVSCSPSSGGRIKSDRYESIGWTPIYDFTGVREGPVTLQARPAPGYLFLEWFDTYAMKTVSENPTITIDINKNTNLLAYFVEATPFTDVGAHDYFFWPVKWAISHDPVITGGVGNNQFGPNRECTREQIVTFLWKANNEPKPNLTQNPFPDVKSKDYFYKAVLWAVGNSITGGVPGGNFGVGMSCTREQAMTFLWAAKGRPEPKTTQSPFPDVKPGDYYYKAVLWAAENGITGGVPGGLFGVGQTCTRAQIITFLYKAYGPVG